MEKIKDKKSNVNLNSTKPKKSKKRKFFTNLSLSIGILVSSIIPIGLATEQSTLASDFTAVDRNDAKLVIPKNIHNEKFQPAKVNNYKEVNGEIKPEKDEKISPDVELLDIKPDTVNENILRYLNRTLHKEKQLSEKDFNIHYNETGFAKYLHYKENNKYNATNSTFDEQVKFSNSSYLDVTRPYVQSGRDLITTERLLWRTRHMRPKIYNVNDENIKWQNPEVMKYFKKEKDFKKKEAVLYRTNETKKSYLDGIFISGEKLDKGVYDEYLLDKDIHEKEVEQTMTIQKTEEEIQAEMKRDGKTYEEVEKEYEKVMTFIEIQRSPLVEQDLIDETSEEFQNRIDKIVFLSDGDFQYQKKFDTKFTGIVFPENFNIDEETLHEINKGDISLDFKWRLKRLKPSDPTSNLIFKTEKHKIQKEHFASRKYVFDINVTEGTAEDVDENNKILIDKGELVYRTEDSRRYKQEYKSPVDLNPKVKVDKPFELTDNSLVTLTSSYEYTNYYEVICGETSCWRIPDWSKGKKYEKEITFNVAKDYKRFIETTDGEDYLIEPELTDLNKTKDILSLSDLNKVSNWVVGESYNIESFNDSKSNISVDKEGKLDITQPRPTQFAEKLEFKDKYMDEQVLVTQTNLPTVVDSIEYSIVKKNYDPSKDKFVVGETTNGKMPFDRTENFKTSTIDSGLFGFYHMEDVDEHLKGTELDGKRSNELESLTNNLDKFDDERINLNELHQKERAKEFRGNDTFVIPFAQSEVKDNTIKFQSDIMTISRYTGYVNNYPIFNNVRDKYKGHKNAPKLSAYFGNCEEDGNCEGYSNATDKHKEHFTNDYNYDFVDSVMYAEDKEGNKKELSDEELKKMQRYYIPIQIQTMKFDGKYSLGLEDEQFHLNYNHLYDIGLNNGGAGFSRPFYFDLYLLGVGGDGKDLKGGYLLTEVEDGSGETSSNSERLTKSELNKLGKTELNRDKLEKVFGVRNFDRDYMSK